MSNAKISSKWAMENWKALTFRFPPEEVKKFRKACQVLGVSQASVIRGVMRQTVQKAQEADHAI